MKKFFSILLVFMMLVSLVPTSVFSTVVSAQTQSSTAVVANKINFSKFSDSFNSSSVYTGDPYGVFCYANTLSLLPANTDVTISFEYYLPSGVDVAVRYKGNAGLGILMNEADKSSILQAGKGTFTATKSMTAQWRWSFGFMKHKEAPAPETIPDMYIWNLKVSYGDIEFVTPTSTSALCESILGKIGNAMEVVTLDSISALINSDNAHVIEMDFSNNVQTTDETDYSVEIFTGHNTPNGGGTYTLTFDYYLPDEGTNTCVYIGGNLKPNTYPGSESSAGLAWLQQGRHKYKATGIELSAYTSTSMLVTQRGNRTMSKFYIWNISLVRDGEDNKTNIMTGNYMKATVQDGNNVTVSFSYVPNSELPVYHNYDNACDADCNICGEIRTVGDHDYDNDCDVDCNICGNVRAVVEHKYDTGKVTKAATCKATGVKTYTCKTCDATKTATIAKKSHSYNAATCTKAKTCKNCGTTSGSKLGHEYEKYVVKATLTKDGKNGYKCERCDYVTSTTKTINRPTTFTLSTSTYTYNGSVRTPSVTVKDSAGKTLTKGTDYTVTYASGRKNAGTYKVTVTMKGNYSGTKTLTFKINPINVSKCTMSLSTATYTYDGATKTPTVTVKNANGTTLTKGTHYTVTYASGRKNVGTYKVTVTMKGNYTGTKTLTFKINPPSTKVVKLTPAKTLMIAYVSRKSSAAATGYQIQYATNKNFTDAKTKWITKYSTGSATLTGLKTKTTYFVRVRTYKKVGSTTYYSGWSTIAYKKTK